MKDEVLDHTLDQLRRRHAKITETIRALEGLASDEQELKAVPVKRRGRRRVGAEERQRIGERMRQYWRQIKEGGDVPS